MHVPMWAHELSSLTSGIPPKFSTFSGASGSYVLPVHCPWGGRGCPGFLDASKLAKSFYDIALKVMALFTVQSG